MFALNLAANLTPFKNEIDSAFINDQYWLVFPFHVYWDSSAQVQDMVGMHKLPLGTGSAKLIAVKYPSEGGYTPGDTWNLFIGKDNRVEQMVYHRGRAQEAERRHRNVGGLQKSRTSADLNGPPRDSRRQAPTSLLFPCVRQADRVRYLGGRAIRSVRTRSAGR